MDKLVYEFDSVTDKQGNDKRVQGKHTNPVRIARVKVGSGALLDYVDIDKHLSTSKVEEVKIFLEHVHIVTANTIYVLRPHIREV